MSEFWLEPGIWALAALLIFAAIRLVASIALRQSRRRMVELVDQIASEERLTRADKASLRAEIERSKGQALLVAAPFAPFAIFGAIAVGIYEGASKKNRNVWIKEIEADIERMQAEAIELTEGVDPRTGNYWRDARHKEIRDISAHLETWNNPIAMTWISIWLVAALPFLGLGYLVSGSIRPFVMNVWGPLREPVISVLSGLHPHRAA